jgi:hypothetical protein
LLGRYITGRFVVKFTWNLFISAFIFLGSPCSESQTPSPDDRFFLYQAPTNSVGTVRGFIEDTPAIIAGAPYSGVGTTSANGMLGDWGKVTETVKIRYLRDGQGRMRAEDVSHPGTIPEYERIRIDDPVGGQRYMLIPYKKTMHALPFVKAAGTVIQLPVTPPPPTDASFQQFLKEFGGDAIRAPGKPAAKTVDLGSKDFDDIRAVGKRHTYMLPGKKEPIRIESEQWFSPELGVVIMNVMSLWVSSDINMKVTYRLQATRAEPDPELFRVPEDYQVSPFPEFKASPPRARP